MRGNFDYTIEGEDGEEIEVTVYYNYSPGQKGCMHLRNGDPGYPDEPPEVEIEKVVDAKGHDYADSIPEKIMGWIEERAIEEAEANDGYYEYEED